MRYKQETMLDRSPELPAEPITATTNTRRCRQAGSQTLANRALREALEPYVDLRKLRWLAAHGGNLQEALVTGAVPSPLT